jgi:hypothetical protein
MLVDLERRLVLFTPPKCGAMTLHEVLPRHGAQPVLGPQFDGGVGEHTTLLPYDVWRDVDRYRFVVATRNPYTRVASLFGHYRRYWSSPHLPFQEFVERIVVAPRHLFFNATVASILEPVENPLDGRRPLRVDAFVRLETLSDDVRRLGYSIAGDLPRVHALPHRGLDEYSPRAQELVESWARHDFDRFGYPRELARAREPCRDGLVGSGTR